MARLARQQEEESNIDLTPMLDVVFIMLIFFIVTASFIKESGIEVNRPDSNQESKSDDPENRNIVFTVTANNEIWLDNRRIDVRAVRANVERLHAERPNAAVIIQANKKAEAKTYAAIADAAREAEVYNVSMTTVDTKDRR